MLRPFKKKIRLNGERNLFHTREDIAELMEFCNLLADKVNELVEENNRLSKKINDVASRTWHE